MKLTGIKAAAGLVQKHARPRADYMILLDPESGRVWAEILGTRPGEVLATSDPSHRYNAEAVVIRGGGYNLPLTMAQIRRLVDDRLLDM